ncbi:hypothetical protein J4443_00095 [Candidatus Woesearchaeota archaeon]|nr:hypothetical protein [Candidatus Woesearchaeota archaeon]
MNRRIMNRRKNINRRGINRAGISALVGTVLLIVFVVSLGLVVVNWSSRLVEKGIEESKSKIGTGLECADVNVRLEGKPGADTVIIVKNNNRNDLDLKGFVARFFVGDNVIVDYANENAEIKAFSAKSFDFNGSQTIDANGNPGVKINWNNVNKVEIIPRVDIGEEIVNCDVKKTGWEK